MAHEQMTVSNTAVSLTAATYETHDPFGAGAYISVQDDVIRYWLDGSNPTASVGLRALADTTIYLGTAEEVRGFRAIRESTDAKINVQYYSLAGGQYRDR